MKKREDRTYNSPKSIPKLNDMLEGFISENPQYGKLSEMMKIMSAWKESVGEQIAGFTNITGYSDGILTVKVTHSVWRNEFYHIENEIKRKLMAKLKDVKIKKIRFV